MLYALIAALFAQAPVVGQVWADAVFSKRARTRSVESPEAKTVGMVGTTDERSAADNVVVPLVTTPEVGSDDSVVLHAQEFENNAHPPLPSYTLAELEVRAMANHPALAEVTQRIEAARGRRWQAGLPPNPTVGYTANEIGNDGSAGQHGVYVGRQFIRGGKLQLSQAVECREIDRLSQEWRVVQQRLLTDVRSLHLAIVWLQRRRELFERFIETNARARSLAAQLFEAGDNTKTDLLLAEIEYEQTATELATLEATLTARWRELERVLGVPYLEPGLLVEADNELGDVTWEAALARAQQSPQLSAVLAELARNRATLARARVEPVPNISTQLSLQYDFDSQDTFTGVLVGMPIPVNNRNQGGIYAAAAEIRATMHQLERTRLAIESRLARIYGDYEFARRQLERIEQHIVPKATEVVRIALQAYEAGEVSMADALNAQRSLLRASLQRLEAERQLRVARVAIEGYLLSDVLQAES